jgi:hypothetical protein
MQNVPVPKEKQNKNEARNKFGVVCQCFTGALHSKGEEFGLLLSSWVTAGL